MKPLVNPPSALSGVGVLVTRPAHQAEPLCALIEAAGGRAWRLPSLAIVDGPDSRAAMATLDDYDLAIFTSVNAVEKALTLRAPAAWPQNLRCAAVGAATARALTDHGVHGVLVAPPPYDSEALLTLPALQQAVGQSIVIIRGEGGREVLADTLRARGARVDYREVYRRVRPEIDAGPIVQAWQRGGITVVTATSAQGLQNLIAMLGTEGAVLLRATPLVVVNARMIQLAAELGFLHPPLVAEAASDEALVAALIAWRRATTAGESE